MTAISFLDLDGLVGEVLPERTLLSTVTDFSGSDGGSGSGGGGGGGGAAAAAAGGDGDGGGDGNSGTQQQTMSTCQSDQTEGTPGLTGSLGLGSNNPSSSQTCTPSSAQQG